MTGIYADISNENYHANPALSASGLKLLTRSPAHYKYSEREQTPAMLKGTALHCAVLEPDRFSKEYIAMPEADKVDKSTRKGGKLWEELEASGRIVMKAEDYADIAGMTMAIQTHEIAGQLIIGGKAEQSIFWDTDILLNAFSQPTTVNCKARPDYIKEVDGFYNIIDIKTTEDARQPAFMRAAYDYGYHLQAAFYHDGCTAVLDKPVGVFAFIVVEKKCPYAVAVYLASQDFMNLGRSSNSQLIKLYAKCMADDKWPAYENEVIELGIPAWAK